MHARLFGTLEYSKHWPYTVAYTIDCVCSKMLNHGLNHGLFLSLFEQKKILFEILKVFINSININPSSQGSKNLSDLSWHRNTCVLVRGYYKIKPVIEALESSKIHQADKKYRMWFFLLEVNICKKRPIFNYRTVVVVSFRAWCNYLQGVSKQIMICIFF